MKTARFIRYADRENIIDDELKPLIPKYKRYVQLEKLCNEWNELHRQNKLEKDKFELLEKHIQEFRELHQKLQYFLSYLNDVRDLIFGDAIHSSRIEFKIAGILDRYKMFFQKRRKEYIKELLKKTSEVRFTFEYPIRVPAEIKHVERDGEKQSIIKKVELKKIKVENVNCFNVGFNGDVVEIIFDTFLGNLYFHNILTLNTDWFEEDYLNLDGYASAIYRRFFVTRSGNKFNQLPIKDLVRYFDFLKNSSYPKVITKAFEDIKNVGLIHNYRFVANGGKFSKGYIEVVKSSK